MKDLIHTNDPGILHVVESHLRQAGLNPFVMDQNVSVLEGSIGILPRRLMVADEEFDAAKRVVIDMGLEHELKDHKGE